MTSPTVFKIHLTRSELHWLAALVGYLQIPLLGEEINHEADIQPDTVLVNLQKMGVLAYRQDAGWQVDSVILVLLQIIANPDAVVMMQIKERDGGAQSAYAYPHSKFPLLVVMKNDNLEFTLHPAIGDLNSHAWALLNLPANLNRNVESFSVRHSDRLTKLLWEFSDITIDTLISVCPSEIEASNLASLFQKTEYVGVISKMISLEGVLSVTSCYNFLWGHNMICERKFTLNGLAEFIPVTRSAVQKILQITLKMKCSGGYRRKND